MNMISVIYFLLTYYGLQDFFPVLFSFSDFGFLIKTATKTILFIIKKQKTILEILLFKKGKAKYDMIKLSDDTARTCMDGLIIPGILGP